MKNKILKSVLSMVAVSIFNLQPTHAAEGGYTNYIPLYGDFGVAIPPDNPGWFFQNDFYYYSADGTELIPGVETDVTISVNLSTLFYVFPKKFLGARLLSGGTYSVAHGAAEAPSISLDSKTTGPTDFTLTPFALYWNFERFHFGFFEYIVLPTGAYQANRPVNPGLNYYSFDTNFSFTYLNQNTGREASFTLGHIYNTENPDTNYRTGQEIHLDYMLNQFLSETSGVGLHGFIHDQFEDDSGVTAPKDGFKAESAGIGPAFFWMPTIGNKKPVFVLKWYKEYHVENRAKGHYTFLTFVLDI